MANVIWKVKNHLFPERAVLSEDLKMNNKQSLTVRNGRDEPFVVRIEPWAEKVTIRPGESLDLDFEGPSGEAIEVEAEPGAIVIYGWAGSTVEIRQTDNDKHRTEMRSSGNDK
jgi:hypothetical protein